MIARDGRKTPSGFERMVNNIRQTLVPLLFALAASVGVWAQSEDSRSNTVPLPSLAELRARGSEALFNLDYQNARQHFKEMERLYPDDPTGPQMLATTFWLETLNQSRRLQAAIYSSLGFYAKTEDKPSPRITQQFHELIRQAATIEKAQLQRNPRDPQTLYMVGATEALKASFAATVERRFISALRAGSTSVDRHREVIKLDPNFHDAELVIGMYDYILGTLSLPVKMLASIAGARGSKKRGIQTLERVARESRWARDDARVLLIAIYKREKRFPEALAVSRELQERYPRNYLFRLETADSLVLQAAVERKANRMTEAAAMERDALNTFDALLNERAMPGSPARALDLVHFRYGEALLLLSQPERAAKEFLAAATVNGAEPVLISRGHLRAAQALDLAGKRNDALALYRAVLARPDVLDAHDQARRGLREPFRESTKASAKP